MLPLFWFWAPTFQWPFSGDMAQKIAPDTSWFFGAIPPKAGKGAIEQKIFETASYGRQLGMMMDVLLDLADQATWPTPQAQERYNCLKELRAKIEKVKSEHHEELAEAAADLLRRMQRDDPDGLRRLLAPYQI